MNSCVLIVIYLVLTGWKAYTYYKIYKFLKNSEEDILQKLRRVKKVKRKVSNLKSDNFNIQTIHLGLFHDSPGQHDWAGGRVLRAGVSGDLLCNIWSRYSVNLQVWRWCQPSWSTPGLISLETLFMTYASLKHVGLNALRLCCNKEARTAVAESAGATIIRRLSVYFLNTARVTPFHQS